MAIPPQPWKTANHLGIFPKVTPFKNFKQSFAIHLIVEFITGFPKDPGAAQLWMDPGHLLSKRRGVVPWRQSRGVNGCLLVMFNPRPTNSLLHHIVWTKTREETKILTRIASNASCQQICACPQKHRLMPTSPLDWSACAGTPGKELPCLADGFLWSYSMQCVSSGSDSSNGPSTNQQTIPSRNPGAELNST